MIAKLYRKIFPQKARDGIYNAFLGDLLLFLRNFDEKVKSKFYCIFFPLVPKTTKNKLYAFMGKHGITHYVFEESLAYKDWNPSCSFDQDRNLYFVIHDGKKLYFPRTYKKNYIELLYKNLVIEQDPHSPHLYVENREELRDKTLLDIGAAEGIFSLGVIDIVKCAYLFECNEDWVQALQATFEPWKEKIFIIRKYVSNKDDGNNITIDTFLKGKPSGNLFLKMDIEGFEQDALAGAKNTLKTATAICCSVCTYHKDEDAEKIPEILERNHFRCAFSAGHLYYNKKFRKALVRGQKLS